MKRTGEARACKKVEKGGVPFSGSSIFKNIIFASCTQLCQKHVYRLTRGSMYVPKEEMCLVPALDIHFKRSLWRIKIFSLSARMPIVPRSDGEGHPTQSGLKGGTSFGWLRRSTWVHCSKIKCRGRGVLKGKTGRWRAIRRIKKGKKGERQRRIFQKEWT